MAIVLGVIVSVFTVMLAVGALTGRVKAKSCCGIADPRRDARMRDAFSDEPNASGSDATMACPAESGSS